MDIISAVDPIFTSIRRIKHIAVGCSEKIASDDEVSSTCHFFKIFETILIKKNHATNLQEEQLTPKYSPALLNS